MYSFTVFLFYPLKSGIIFHLLYFKLLKNRGHLVQKSSFKLSGPAPKGPELEKNVRLAAALRLAGWKKKETLVVEGVWKKRVILLGYWYSLNSTETEGHRKGQETAHGETSREDLATIHRLCPLRGLPIPRARQGFVNFLKEKKEFRERIPYQERQKCVVVQDLPSCCILRKAKADAKAKASQPLRRGWQMKMTRLAIPWDHQDWPMVQWLCVSYHPELPTVEPNPNTSCLKKDPLAWILNQISPKKPCVGEIPWPGFL